MSLAPKNHVGTPAHGLPAQLTCPSSTDLPGGRSTEDPGAPLLSAVCVSPSSHQPPGPGAAKIRKTLRSYPPGWKTTGGKCLKLRSANLSTWRILRNSENAAKTVKIRNHVEIGKNTKDVNPEDKIPGTKDAETGETKPQARRRTPTRSRGPQGTATTTTGRTKTEKPQQEENKTTSRGAAGREP